MGASISYYALFSLAPLLLIVISVAGLVFGREAAQGEIVAQLAGIMGHEGAEALQAMLKAAREPKESIAATCVSLVVFLVGATATFAELQNALDRIWEVPASKRKSGLWHLLRTRLLSFGLVLGMGFLTAWFLGWEVVLEIVNFAVSAGIFTLLFASIYKTMPRAKIAWRDVWTGATVTSLLFMVGKALIGLYLGTSGLASGFGAAGSVVVLVAWVYYSAQIFLWGAEYTWVYANSHGSRTPLTYGP